MVNFTDNVAALAPQAVALKVGTSGVGFIDVRTQREYLSGHARGAINIPLSELQDQEGILRNWQEIYVICQSGGRSAKAVAYLRSRGMNAMNVSGGTTEWALAGLAMER